MELERFLDLLRARAPGAPVTRAVVALNLALFAVMAVSTGALWQIPSAVLIAWGGNDGHLTLSGQGWRLLSSVFLHGGLIHVALNMLALYQSGQLVERLFGSGRFALVYLVSGTLASLASVWWRQDVVSIGASGAIFGVFGALLAYLAVRRRDLPVQVHGSMRRMTLSFVGYSLVLGFAIPGVDNAAHVGGLCAGLAIGGILSAAGRSPLPAAAGALALALLGAWVWHGIDREQLPSPAVQRFAENQPLLAERERELLTALGEGRMNEGEALEIIKRELLPNWDALIGGLQQAAAQGDRRASELLEYAQLERSALEAMSLALTTGHPAWLATAADLRRAANRALRR